MSRETLTVLGERLPGRGHVDVSKLVCRTYAGLGLPDPKALPGSDQSNG